ncbi:MAG: aspartyl protease family protein [Cyanobacteria bacterium P01_D01_bin.36]
MSTLSIQDSMGAVSSSITLTNAIDEGMVSRGVLAPKHLRQHTEEALVDTGSVHLVISEQIAQSLGLRILGQQGVEYADGRRVTVGVTEAILIECEGRQTTDEALVTGNGILIGQVILEKLDLLVDCRQQKLIPNPEHPDYPVSYILDVRN